MHFKHRDTNRWNIKKWEEVCQANTSHEITEMITLKLDIVDVKIRDIIWDTERDFIKIKGPITYNNIKHD